MMRYSVLTVLVLCACAGSTPRFTNQGQEPELLPAEPVSQIADLTGELLVAPPGRNADRVIEGNPESILPLVGMGDAPPPVITQTLVDQLPDSTEVAPPIELRGPRREYQIQIAITPSAEEAEDFKERLTPLLEEEEIFIVFTSPYYRIRVGRKATREAADQLLQKVHELGYTGAMVIPITITPDERDGL
ncbi:SPOR domain-containing protein [Candidatus Zixiibacteriota bacterium]